MMRWLLRLALRFPRIKASWESSGVRAARAARNTSTTLSLVGLDLLDGLTSQATRFLRDFFPTIVSFAIFASLVCFEDYSVFTVVTTVAAGSGVAILLHAKLLRDALAILGILVVSEHFGVIGIQGGSIFAYYFGAILLAISACLVGLAIVGLMSAQYGMAMVRRKIAIEEGPAIPSPRPAETTTIRDAIETYAYHQATTLLEWSTAWLPPKIVDEVVGNTFERMAKMHDEGVSHWRIQAYALRRIFWCYVYTLRDVGVLAAIWRIFAG